MADSKTGVGNIQDESEVSCTAREQGSALRMMGTCRKDTRATLQGFPLGQSVTISVPIYIMLVTDYNPLSRITNTDSILT